MLANIGGFRRRLLRWYQAHRRDLPWRVPLLKSPDSYHVLISEAMLQQTQVATVIPYFRRFLEQFPTLETLAGSTEEQVLRLWQGLGYYSRARSLRRAAIAIMNDHNGEVPSDPDALLALPGVGRYTAGAIASIAFGKRTPIVDGNVARVICRIDKITSDPREKSTSELLWIRAADIMPTARADSRSMGDFNSALMELGATICTPRNPKCLVCPVRMHCEALVAGMQESIPLPKKAKPTPLVIRWTYCIRRDNRWLIEQRPPTGRWAGMWQFVTRESENVDLLPVRIKTPQKLTVIKHALTHRRYEIHAMVCDAVGTKANGTWVTLQELDRYPMPRPHVKLAQMLAKTLSQ